MKKMNRKLLYCILLLPLFLVAGCQSEIDGQELDKPDPGESPMVFTAAIESGDATKTTLGAPSGGDRPVKWSSNDQLSIGGARYDISEIAAPDSTNATFTGRGAEKTGGQNYYEAFYPASLYGKTGSTVTLTLPATQLYTAPSPAEGNRVVISHLPMYARSENTSLKFHNLCTVLNFQLTGAGRVDSVVVLSASRYLSGDFEIAGSETGGWYARIKDSGTNRSRTVTLDCSAGGGVQLSVARPTEFCVGLPADTYPSDDLTVKVYSGIAEVATLTQDPAAGDFLLERNKIFEVGKSIAEFSVGPNPEDKVYFSPGNLQVNYIRTGSGYKREWLFSENQWDVFCPDVDQMDSLPKLFSDTVKLSHFGWATAGHKNPAGDYGYEDSHGCYQPHNVYPRNPRPGLNFYYAFGPSSSTWSDRIGSIAGDDPDNTWNRDSILRSYCDWGIHFDDDGVGYEDKYDGSWFTLSIYQWNHLLTGRTLANEKRAYAHIVIDPVTNEFVEGLVIVPDFWACPAGCSFDTDLNKGYQANEYHTDTTWDLMEASGAIFLPACGHFEGGWHNVGPYVASHALEYWASSASAEDWQAHTLFHTFCNAPWSRCDPMGVRLVHKCTQP